MYLKESLDLMSLERVFHKFWRLCVLGKKKKKNSLVNICAVGLMHKLCRASTPPECINFNQRYNGKDKTSTDFILAEIAYSLD